MQRLFSTFPNSWPGCGLLLLRLAICLPLTAIASRLLDGSAFVLSWIDAAIVLGSVTLIPGWLTPLGGTVMAVAEGYLALNPGALNATTIDTAHLAQCLIGLSLVMLGPGAWSVDAHLYGRKRIEVGGR